MSAASILLAYKLNRQIDHYTGRHISVRGGRKDRFDGTLRASRGVGHVVGRIPFWVVLTLDGGQERRVPWWKAVYITKGAA